MHIRQGLAIFLVVMHLILGCATMFYLFEISTRFKTKYEHALLNLAAMLLMVIAMCYYRVFQGLNTRALKYIHMVTHVGVVTLSGISFEYLQDDDGEIKGWDYLHGFPSMMASGGYCVQMVLAVLFLVILFPHGNFRFNVAIVHDIIGIWLYDCFLGSAISGWHFCCDVTQSALYETDKDTGVETDAFVGLLDNFKTMMIVNSFFVHFVVLFPHFQWDVVGAI